MQPLARDGLTAEQVTALLTGPSLSVSAGCDLLNLDLSFREDISGDLEGGTVARNLNATLHGTCDLALTRELTWGVDLVRPYMVLTDGTVTARFNVGVYALTTPESLVGESVTTYAVTGFDRVYLLNREVGADYTVTAGTTYRTALLAVFSAAGLSGVLIDGAAAESTVPVTRLWPLVATSPDPDQTDSPVTYLRVVNDLLRAINFRGVWADENGLFRCEAYVEPAARTPGFTFTADDMNLTILGERRKVVQDVWATPNRWVFIASNPPDGVTPSIGNGYVYQVDNVFDGLTSQTARGLIWTQVFTYEVATTAALAALGDRRVAQDRRTTSRFDVTTGPFPPAGHADVFTYTDAAVGGSRKVQSTSWQFDLSGSDVTWVWEEV